jgi:beta-xylosidase
MLSEVGSATVTERVVYCNPVFDRYLADPFVFRFNDVYFAVGTRRLEAGVFPILRSTDLAHWEEIGTALDPPSPTLGTDYWAPEIAYEDGRFYMYYSVGFRDVGHRLRVATSNLPQGPYVDSGIDLLDPKQVGFAIDASPFRDVDGAWYLFYARDFLTSEGNGRPGTALVVDRLKSMTELAGEERVVLRATRDWQRFMRGRDIYGGLYDWHCLEGPCAIRHDGRYYCFYSGGRWENETYGVDYAVADSMAGPWHGGDSELPRVLRTVPGRLIGPGHNSVVKGPDGESDFIVYHAWDAAMTARRMCIDKIVWTPDGPRCTGPTWAPQTL